MEETDRIVRVEEVCRLVGRSRTTLWRACRGGDFPLPFKLSARAVGWRLAEIRAWMDSRPRATAYAYTGESQAAPMAAKESE